MSWGEIAGVAALMLWLVQGWIAFARHVDQRMGLYATQGRPWPKVGDGYDYMIVEHPQDGWRLVFSREHRQPGQNPSEWR